MLKKIKKRNRIKDKLPVGNTCKISNLDLIWINFRQKMIQLIQRADYNIFKRRGWKKGLNLYYIPNYRRKRITRRSNNEKKYLHLLLLNKEYEVGTTFIRLKLKNSPYSYQWINIDYLKIFLDKGYFFRERGEREFWNISRVDLFDRIMITNDVENKTIHRGDLYFWLEHGWKRGRNNEIKDRELSEEYTNIKELVDLYKIL